MSDYDLARIVAKACAIHDKRGDCENCNAVVAALRADVPATLRALGLVQQSHTPGCSRVPRGPGH